MASIAKNSFMLLLLAVFALTATAARPVPVVDDYATTPQDAGPMSSQYVDAVVVYLNILAKCFAERVVPAVPGCADELGASFLRGKMQLSQACRNAVSSLPDACTEAMLKSAVPPAT
ncbi:hypothetical protein Ancab_032951, partial [Ancistrocladus abbreviatus]